MSDDPHLSAILEEMKSHIQRRVAEGFDTADGIAQDAVEMFLGDAETEALEKAAAKYTKQAIAAHLKEEKTWPAAEIGDEIEQFRQRRLSARGYTFYHMQIFVPIKWQRRFRLARESS